MKNKKSFFKRRIIQRLKILRHNQAGFSLIEVLISIAILGAIGATFLAAVGTSSSAVAVADRRDTAKQLAVSQMEYTKHQPYSSVAKINTPPGYQIDIQYPAIAGRTDGNIQKIFIIVSFQGTEVIRLEDFEIK